MALIDCWECAGQVSELAVACPHCGAPQGAGRPKRRRRLRWLWRLLILVGLAWLLYQYAQRQGWIDDEMTGRMQATVRQSAERFGEVCDRSTIVALVGATEPS